MNTEISGSTVMADFDEHKVLHRLKHYLPAQSPLKDFIHHNTLHSFQNRKFYDAIREASAIFGFKVALSINEFRDLYKKQLINPAVLNRVIADSKGSSGIEEWTYRLLRKEYDLSVEPRIGELRAVWKKQFSIDLDIAVQPALFRILCSYLDQGIAIWSFPVWDMGFLDSLREIEKNSFNSIFNSARVRNILLDPENFKDKCTLKYLLGKLVGDVSLYEQYLFDQQFAHQGWSGMVSAIEDFPENLVDKRKISVHDLVIFELLLEMDALDTKFGEDWEPLCSRLSERPTEIFAAVPETELSQVMELWQDAFEWSYYDQVLAGIKMEDPEPSEHKAASFQAMFCIDDREKSLRRYLEQLDTNCETFGTPGFFNVEFFFQPEHGRSYTKQCPAPVTPKYLIKEIDAIGKRQKDVHFAKPTFSLLTGWVISQTLGFWSAVRLFVNLFRPSLSPATAYSLRHMDSVSNLSVLNKDSNRKENGLQIGFNTDEMAVRVEGLLRSIGLVEGFAPIVYVVGHGSSSVNNPHYAAYDCGACSGRPGSVNARVLCSMANHPKVREILNTKGISIPEGTQFIGALHDTTRDDIIFYDEDSLNPENTLLHAKNNKVFAKALDHNAKERSRRFEAIDSRQSPSAIHEKVRRRSVSLFEPRPELNHATNALCIVGRRKLYMDLFLDRRVFANSFDYKVDPKGEHLLNILKAAAPVCGGINLEYLFSRVDNQKLGAGTKLPHNVMGLFGVANGIDGDLRPGLPMQMVEVHDPVRLLMIVEHFPDVVLQTIQKNPETYEWFINEWVHLVAVDPENKDLFLFRDGAFTPYEPTIKTIEVIHDITPLIESHQENFPVYLIR